jgi:methanogenic corrinoid protein MtbC1
MMPTEDFVQRFTQALLAVDQMEALRLLTTMRATLAPLQLVDHLIVPALERIGVQWERGEAALSQVYMSGRICETLVQTLLPPDGAARPNQPRLAIAVLEDFHLLGKNMVCSALRASGFTLIDYGHVDVAEVVRRVQADSVEVLLLSTLMLPSALKIKEVRTQLDALGLHVKIVAGGAPFRFDTELGREVGADAVGHNALEAIEIVRQVMSTSNPVGVAP